jgi:hypothetical protein
MKFLVMTSIKKQISVPPDAMPSILEAQREWIHERLNDGTIEVIYGFTFGGGVAIVNADGGDELNSLVLQSPAFMTLDWEIRPLAEIDVALSNAIGMFERAGGRVPALR